MAVNQIKTRILNKYDILANYSTFKPLKGEICIAEVATVQKPNEIAAGFDGQTYDERPIVGIKVGDGQHTFAELPWVQAAAGDVTARMKEFTGEADIDAAIAALTSGRKLATVAELNALSEEFASVKATVNHAEHGNTALKSAIDTLSSDKVNKSFAEDADATDKLVKETTVDSKITTAKGELNLAIQGVQSNVDKLADGAVKTNTEAITGINAKIGEVEYTGASMTAAIAALQASVGDSSEGLGSQVSALKETVGDATKGLVKDVADLKQADTNMSGRVDGIEGRVKANEDKLAGIDGTVADSISAVNATATEALGKANTLIGSDSNDSNKSVREIAIAVLTEKLIPENADAARDTLEEIAAWIQSHPNDASAMNAAITAVKINLGYTGENYATAPDTVDKRIADAISALETKINITNYVDKTTHKEATDAIAGLTAKVDTGDKNVSKYVEDYVAAELAEYANSGALHSVEARVEAIEKAPYATESYADGKASAAQAAAEATAKAELDKLSGYAENETATTVKANAEGIASLNTTVKALVENDGNDGIVSAVTQNTETGKISVAHKKITMDEMDENEVFVFYCGNASGYDANFQVTL